MRECIKFYHMAYSIMRIEILLSHIRDKNKFKSEGFLFTLRSEEHTSELQSRP